MEGHTRNQYVPVPPDGIIIFFWPCSFILGSIFLALKVIDHFNFSMSSYSSLFFGIYGRKIFCKDFEIKLLLLGNVFLGCAQLRAASWAINCCSYLVRLNYCFYIVLEDFSIACEQNINAETKNLFGVNNSKKIVKS